MTGMCQRDWEMKRKIINNQKSIMMITMNYNNDWLIIINIERYVPKRLRDEKKDHYWEDELGKCTSIIKVRWTMMIIKIRRLISPYLHQSDWWKMVRYILVFWMRHTCLHTLLFRWFKLLYTLGWEYWIL